MNLVEAWDQASCQQFLYVFLHVFNFHLSINMLIVHTMNVKKLAVLFSNLRYSLEALISLQKKIALFAA